MTYNHYITSPNNCKAELNFDTIYTSNYRRIFGKAYSILHSVEESEDATQEAFLRLYEVIDTITSYDGAAGWLYRVVTRLCIDRWRRYQKRPDKSYLLLEDGECYHGTEEIDYTRADNQKLLQRAMEVVTEDQRRALYYIIQTEGDVMAAARMAGANLDCFKSWLQRARAKCRAELRSDVA